MSDVIKPMVRVLQAHLDNILRDTGGSLSHPDAAALPTSKLHQGLGHKVPAHQYILIE